MIDRISLCKRVGRILIFTVIGFAVLFGILSLVATFALTHKELAGRFASGVLVHSPLSGAVYYGIFILFVYLFVSWICESLLKSSIRKELLFLLSLSFLAHLLLIRLLPAMVSVQNAMTFDPSVVLRSMESGKVCFLHPPRNQAWCNYETLMSALAVIFRGGLQLGRIFQSLCCTMVLLPLFHIANRLAGRKVARFTLLVVGLSPTLIMYSMILTSEFLAAALMFFAACFFWEALSERCIGRRFLLMLALCGVMLGISDLFKWLSPVFWAALFVCLIAMVLFRAEKALFIRAILTIAIAIPCGKMARSLGQTVLAEIAGARQVASAVDKSSPYMYEFILGLNLESEGMYSGALARKFLDMSEEQRTDFFKATIKKDWKRYPGLMVRKFRNIHGANTYHHGSVSTFTSVFKDAKGRLHTPSWIRPLADSATVFFKLLFLLGAVGLMCSINRGGQFIAPGLFSTSLVLAFAVVEQLIEGHGRYKTAIYPFYFMTIPYICVWLDRDNPVYMHIGGLVRRLLGRNTAAREQEREA